MRSNRTYWLIAFLLILGLLLSGCMQVKLVSNNEAGESTKQSGEEIIELEFWHTYSELELEVFNTKVLPLFETEYPAIKINAVRKDHTGQLKDDVQAAVADNKQPDVMRMDVIWVPEFAKNGSLKDLSNLEHFPDVHDQFIGSLIQSNMYKGKYYGIPVNANTRAAIFNKQLLKEAGLDHPPSTFQELVAATKRLQQQRPDIYGIGICCSNVWGSLPYFWTFGGQLMDDNYTRASGFLNGSASQSALKTMKEWLDEGIISPSIIGGEPGTWDGILKGQLLMIDEPHWFYTVNETGPNKELLQGVESGLFPSEVRLGTSIIGGENLVLFEKSPFQKEAWQFMRWMVTEEPQRIMSETGLIPTIKNLQGKNENPIFDVYLEQLDHANPRPPVPAWTKIEDVFARMLERILTNEQTITEAVDEAAVMIDSLLMED
jgi:multiple sugar transport system substrate-binding protein